MLSMRQPTQREPKSTFGGPLSHTIKPGHVFVCLLVFGFCFVLFFNLTSTLHKYCYIMLNNIIII